MSSREVPERQSGTVRSFDGATIHYDLYPAPSRKLVLVIPGFWRTRRYRSMDQLAELLHALGYQVAIVDMRGHGDSAGIYGFNLYEQEDAYAVARHLYEKLGVSAISLIGFSIGGAIAVCTVSRHLDLPWRSLILVSAMAKFSLIWPLLNPFVMHRHVSPSNVLQPPRFTWRFLTSRKLCAADEISSLQLPIALLHVKDDWLVHHRHSLLLYERCKGPKELHLIDIPGRYHADRILAVARERFEPLVRDFLSRTLDDQ